MDGNARLVDWLVECVSEKRRSDRGDGERVSEEREYERASERMRVDGWMKR